MKLKLKFELKLETRTKPILIQKKYRTRSCRVRRVHSKILNHIVYKEVSVDKRWLKKGEKILLGLIHDNQTQNNTISENKVCFSEKILKHIIHILLILMHCYWIVIK